MACKLQRVTNIIVLVFSLDGGFYVARRTEPTIEITGFSQLELRDKRRDPEKGPLILIPYITLIYPLYSLIKPLYNPKGPFKGLSFSPLIEVSRGWGYNPVFCKLNDVVCKFIGNDCRMLRYHGPTDNFP